MIRTIRTRQKVCRLRDEARKRWIARKALPIWKSINYNINGEALLEKWIEETERL